MQASRPAADLESLRLQQSSYPVKRLPNTPIDSPREPVAADDIGSVADRDLLDRGFRGLPVEQRAVLVLRHIVGMPLEEVAQTLDIPSGTARSRLYRALQSMRASIEADTGLERVLETFPTTPQVRHLFLGRRLERDEGAGRRSTDHDHPPDQDRRSRLMFSSTGVISAIAILALAANVINDGSASVVDDTYQI